MTIQQPASPVTLQGTHTPTATAPKLFPPSLLDTVEIEFHKILNRNHPNLLIDIHTTWLSSYEHKQGNIPPFTKFPTQRPTPPIQWIRKITHSITVRDSLIDFFLGALELKEDRTGWFIAADSVAVTHQITALNYRQLHAIYTELSETLSTLYQHSLLSYWGVIEAAKTTRMALFIEERVLALRMEARAGMDQKHLTSQQVSMLETMLQYRQSYSSTSVKKHGVFSLALALGDIPPLNFAGVFILSHACTLNKPTVGDGRLGPVLMYSPNSGLEGFDSFPLLIQSLSKRMTDTAQKQWLLKNVSMEDPDTIASLEATTITAQAWTFSPIEGDFLNVQFLAQIAKQQTDFEHCVKTAKVQRLKSNAFLKVLSRSLDPGYQFNNFLNLNWNDRYILYSSMPKWWRAMSAEKKDLWLIAAKKLGQSIIELNQLTEDNLVNPQLSDQTLEGYYTATVIKDALADKHVLLNPDDINIDVTYRPPLLPPYAPGLALPPSDEDSIFKRYTLSSLAAEKPGMLKLSSAQSIVVTDGNGGPINGLDALFVRELVSRIDSGSTIDQFLITRLQTSAYAKSLHDLALRLGQIQLNLGLFGATQDIPQLCQRWIKAVVDAPEAIADRQVGRKKILVQFLAITDVPLSNVLKIGPQADGEEGVVLCTLNAPDGIVFRWFADMESVKTRFLENPTFTRYLLLQLPIAKRPLAMRAIKLDQWQKHYHLPNVFKLIPTTLPVPELIWNPLSLIEQTRDFIDESHGIKIKHLIVDGTANLCNAREIVTDEHHTAMHLATNVMLLFLPPPISIPITLGLAMYTAWNGFRYIEENNYEGAAKELLIALDYLVSSGISKLELTRSAALPLKLFRPAPRPLTRYTGADGEVHIGVLSKNRTMATSSDAGADIVFDALKYRRIEIHDEAFYIGPHANLFGEMNLYRRLRENTQLQTQRGEFAVPDQSGNWTKAPYQGQGTSPKIYEEASHELGQLIAQWPASAEALTPAQRLRFETDYLSMAKSNAESFPEVAAYCEGGSAEINSALRTGIETEESIAFSREFYQLDEYHGLAYRAAYVSTFSLEKLQGQVGTIFADTGIQSASVSPLNALQWANDEFVRQSAGPDTHAIFLIFDDSVSKKNMFTNFLGDHVGIAPNTPLQLMAFKKINNINYAYFSAPEQIPTDYVNIFTGRRAAFF
ncbi:MULTISPECIES: dermonecrotic toxin domain-containing protein [unclassified Pseudomonas]|uniref:dermonecrotic toxin domain-containing protein n=1 Tax=unclassified Pseudomonas TaxID=196821 RepID=UPI002B2376BE|nr:MULTISPECIES: DUF6543 domain-containing protein [unclassified Pseudomonas]MEA9977584.1 hypothetical protein [Pseudomonas sp. RTS4]MEB0196607.1 hypothetical protein [Pseudomonas sp. 5S4]MEB0244508.1 hypothetical protein [Pseudomonas sp. 10S5]